MFSQLLINGGSPIRNQILLLCALTAICITPLVSDAKPRREIIGEAQALWCYHYPLLGQCGISPLQVLVKVYTENNDFITEVLSDNAGHFEVSELKPGTYLLEVAAVSPPPLYFLRYTVATQLVTIRKKDPVAIEILLEVAP